MDILPQRQCKHCKEFYPLNEGNFYTFRNRQGGLSFRHTCKSCFDANAKKNYATRLERDPDYERNRSKRRWAENTEKMRQYHRDKYWRNPEKYNAYQKEYRERNIEKSRKQDRETMRRLRAHNPEHYREYSNQYVQKNRAIYRAASRKHYWDNRQSKLAYRKAHPQSAEYRRPYNKASKAKRRALSTQAEGSFTAQEIRDLMDWQDGKCFYCGVDIRKKYTADHYYPLSRGGDNYIHNIVLACIHCNSSKQDKLPHEFDSRCL